MSQNNPGLRVDIRFVEVSSSDAPSNYEEMERNVFLTTTTARQWTAEYPEIKEHLSPPHLGWVELNLNTAELKEIGAFNLAKMIENEAQSQVAARNRRPRSHVRE